MARLNLDIDRLWRKFGGAAPYTAPNSDTKQLCCLVPYVRCAHSGAG